MSEGAQSLAEIGVLNCSVPGKNTGNTASMSGRLLVVQVKVGQLVARGLIDTGATHNFVSESWVHSHDLPIVGEGVPISITLADGRQYSTVERRLCPVEMEVGGFEWTDSPVLMTLEKYDLILGKPWLELSNPTIDFCSHEVIIQKGKDTYTVVADASGRTINPDDSIEGLLQFISVRQARKSIKKGAECFAVKLCKGDDQSPNPWPLDKMDISVSGQERSDLLALLRKYSKIFPAQLPKRLPPFRSINHEIDIADGGKPPSRPPFRLSQPELDELKRQLEDLLNHGFIEPSSSPYGAPVFFVRKADGSLRMVCDWRPLNNITVKVQACLPSIEDLFDTVRGAKFFTKLDLMSGYHQVRVRDADVQKTAINTPFGHYHFRVMGFGLTNAPATFMALMNDVLRPFLRRHVVVFLDDILVFSQTWPEHLHHLDSVLSVLEKEELYCKPSKCQFGASSIKFLGHVVCGDTIAPDDDKLKAVRDWKVPQSTTDVRRFLGFANYFRRFINGYSGISRPLEQLTGKYCKFSWNSSANSAFVQLKEALVSAPVLRLADVSKPFRVMTDASDSAIGGVLLQQDDSDGEWQPVAYTSRRLRPEESNYHAMERETLAALHAIRTWKLYLFRPFELVTDNKGLTYLKSKSSLSKREARWIDFLADFDIKFVHRPGKDNIADGLSRSMESEACLVLLDDDPDLQHTLEVGYQADPRMRSIISRLKGTAKTSLSDRYIWNEAEKRLYLKDVDMTRLCIPKSSLRRKLLKLCHDSVSAGHPGRDRTYSRLARNYYWPRMGKSVAWYVKSCRICQRTKGDRPRQCPLQPLPTPELPWQDIGMDFITGLPLSTQGNDAILTFIDRLTKQAHFVPTKASIDASGTASLYIQNVYRLHGLSRSIVSDRDPRFTAKMYQTIFENLGVKLKMSTASHPQTDGITERVHRVIGQVLRSVVNHSQTNWEERLPYCEFAYNDMVQGSTCQTPFYLNFGRHPLSVPEASVPLPSATPDSSSAVPWLRLQSEAVRLAKDSLRAAMDDQTLAADRTRTDITFKKGDLVMVHRDFMSTPVSRDQPCSKLKPRWFGPFTVIQVLSRATVKLKLPFDCRVHPVFNVAALKPYFHDDVIRVPAAAPPAPLVDADGHERYIVDSVLSHRIFRGRDQYLVRWVGYEEPTWEPRAYLLDESGQPIIPLQQFLSRVQPGN